MNSSTFYPRLFAVAALAALGYALVRIFEPFLVPILWAVLLALLLFPINSRLRRRLGNRTSLAAGLLTAGVAVLVAAPSVLLVLVFANQATDLAARLSIAAARNQIHQPGDILSLPVLQNVLRRVQGWVPVTAGEFQLWAVDGLKKILGMLAQSSGALVVSALEAVVGLVLTVFLLFFFLRDGETMARRFLGIVPMSDERKGRLVAHLAAVTKAVVLGTLVTAILQGALVGLAFALVGLPSPVVFAAIAAACSLLPVGGTAFVWLPGAVALALQARWGAAIFLAAWGAILVSTVDNLLRPLFISGRAQIAPLPVFFGVIGGLAAFGPIGIFLGPVLVALALALLGFVEESRKEALSSQLSADGKAHAGSGSDPTES